ncbi:MAG: tetratricopeptide repeat protein [Micrococcales bacterium]|nr:tetratricopeptide repeat protein [Micrococcales bacterium]
MTIEFGSAKAASEVVNVPALVMRVDAASIRDYLPLSEKIPILMLFVQASDPASEALEKSVTALVQKTAGAMIALVVDAAASPELVQAFELNQIPSAYGLLKGQPAPLFVGNQPMEQIQLVITKVLAVAKENGLTGKAVVKEIEKEPELSPTLNAAYAAIDSGDYKGALALFEKALLENPNDALAHAGLAQVKLLLRLEGKDLAVIIDSDATTDESILEKADALIATGNSAAGFNLLLGLFEKTAKDAREPIRLRLVEMFMVAGNDNPDVVAARKALSLLLF